MKYAAALLIGLIAVEPGLPRPSAIAAPFRADAIAAGKALGQVRADGRAVADARGPFNALGATMFWGAWAYKFDLARLERNLATLSAAGFDYVRVLGSVGGTGWEDRQTDPRWSDYDAIIAGMTDLAYDKYGLRVQWTIFGGAPFTPSGAARAALVDRFASMARGREHKVFAFEIANEAWHNGFRGAEGLAELRSLGKRLNDKTAVLVALSAPASGAACATYADSGADAMTIHYARTFGNDPESGPTGVENGPLRPLLRPWSFGAAHIRACRGQLPQVVFNNEPIGPESSVRQEEAPARIAAAYVMTFLAGNAAYVFHSGPGIRGGGAADVAPNLHRHANFDELPSFKSISTALGAATTYLPPGLANWSRHEPNAADAPLQGYGQLYSASKGSDFVALVVGATKPITLRARVNASIDVRQAATGQLVTHVDVSSGERFTVSTDEAIVMRNRGSAAK
jgi:hypothetical protein